MSQICILNRNLPLKWGHLSILDTLLGPQGAHNRGVPLYSHAARQPCSRSRLFHTARQTLACSHSPNQALQSPENTKLQYLHTIFQKLHKVQILKIEKHQEMWYPTYSIQLCSREGTLYTNVKWYTQIVTWPWSMPNDFSRKRGSMGSFATLSRASN